MVIERARELGIALSESPEFQRILKARAAIDDDEVLTNQINLLHEKQRMIADLLAEGADSDSRIDIATLSNEIEDIQTELLVTELFSEMMNAQHAFEELMRRVNRVIATCIGADFPEEAEKGCGGDCGSCGGCMH